MALMGDFQQIYSINLEGLWDGTVSVRRALVLSGHLLDNPLSQYRTELLGDPRFLGWDATTSATADLFDITLVVAYAKNGKTPPESDLYPRPKRSAEAPAEAMTIADFDVDHFMRVLST